MRSGSALRGAAILLACATIPAVADPPTAGVRASDPISLLPLAPITPGADADARCQALIEATRLIDVILNGAESIGHAPRRVELPDDPWNWTWEAEVRAWLDGQPNRGNDLVQRYLNTFAPQTRRLMNRADYQADQAFCLDLIEHSEP